MRVEKISSGNYCGLPYDQGIMRLVKGTEAGEIVIVSYATEKCARGVFCLDIESEFEDIFDELGYKCETVYSDDSMLVWFGVKAEDPQTVLDRVARKILALKHLAGLRVNIGECTFVV